MTREEIMAVVREAFSSREDLVGHPGTDAVAAHVADKLAHLTLTAEEGRVLSVARSIVTGNALNHKLKPGELQGARDLAGLVIARLLGGRP